MMAQEDEKIKKEAYKLVPTGIFSEEKKVCKLVREAIKKGIQMERERIRVQVETDSFEIRSPVDLDDIGINTQFMLKTEIDIWDDVK